MKNRYVSISFLSLVLCLTVGVANANTHVVAPKVVLQNSTAAIDLRDISTQFAPKPSINAKLDYDVWNTLLNGMVIETGLSVREEATTKQAITGTRILRGSGHTSAYRLEGNRVVFSLMDDEYKALIADYQKSLVEVANRIDVTKLSRNEQLVYWFNLHNVTVISEIAKSYPISSPTDIRIGEQKQTLDDAKIINIRGRALSLRDIREKIVYAHWETPDVIYGFFTGTISSPSIQPFAYNSSNVSKLLNRGAVEYANSIRGFRRFGKTRYVSSLYRNMAPFYFSNFEADLSDHFATHMRSEVYADYDGGGRISASTNAGDVADMVRGELDNTRVQVQQLAAPGQAFTANSQGSAGGDTFIGGVDDTGRTRGVAGSSNLQIILQEFRQKYLKQRARGLAGTVEIEDIETVDPDIK